MGDSKAAEDIFPPRGDDRLRVLMGEELKKFAEYYRLNEREAKEKYQDFVDKKYVPL